MKKLITVASMLALSFSFGCKKEEAAAPAEKKVEVPAPAPAPVEAPKAAEPAPAPAAADSTGIPECDGYLATAAKFAACDKLPKEAKDAQTTALEAAKTGWASLKDPAVPAEAKKAAADACKQSDDALKSAWTAAGCM
jgi:hypothetical protein